MTNEIWQVNIKINDELRIELQKFLKFRSGWTVTDKYLFERIKESETDKYRKSKDFLNQG